MVALVWLWYVPNRYSSQSPLYLIDQGHELTHGFDNQGRLYNGHGRLVNWWEPNTSKVVLIVVIRAPLILFQEFDDKVQCIIDQYSKFEPIPGVHVNGKLTQGYVVFTTVLLLLLALITSENVADNGGLANSYRSALSQLGQGTLNDMVIFPSWLNLAEEWDSPSILNNPGKTLTRGTNMIHLRPVLILFRTAVLCQLCRWMVLRGV